MLLGLRLICEGVALSWHGRCGGADSEELAPGLPALPALQKRNGCAIYLLRSSLRHASCRWASAITRRNRSKNNRGLRNFLDSRTGGLNFMGWVETDRDGLIDLTHRSSDGTLMTGVLQPFLSLKRMGPLF